ncbi:Outer membrane protein (porin) [Marinobacter sp. es.048]|uniref:porin n=1 Tax=Marinobacter sp. es.048 TaxID=1761795 RepID=UPI000B5956ED|nr:porin [Marinobacter sp. es.048]SNC76700.1 Outer membrane protein (porin) [Marinobacter sp. es.048]
MKKTLIASAIAAATFSGSAFAQSEMSASELAAKMDSMPSVYGNIQYALIYDDVKGGDNGVDHRDNGSTLGIKHDHEIAPGITGFFKLELEGIDADDKAASSGIDALDEAYIGVKGDSFGQVWIGSDDSTYESAIDTIANFYEAADLSIGGSYTTGEGDMIQYMTPSFGGLTLGAAVQVNGDGTTGGKSYPYQLAAIYALDNLELAVAMDSNDGSTGYSSNGLDPVGNNENTYGVRGTFSAGDLSFTGEYQTRKDVGDVYGVQGVYVMGANQFALSYEAFSADNNGVDNNTITLQALHNVSNHMYVYFEGYLGGGDDNAYGVADESEASVAALGAVYYF